MNPRILVVKEYEKIQMGDLPNQLSKEEFQLLENFIDENSREEIEEPLYRFMKISSSYGEKVISIMNYVGVINVNNQIQIEILPKIDIEDDEDDRELRKIFLRMLGSLKEFENKSFKNAYLNSFQLPIYEIFIHTYLTEVRALIKKGLKRDYFVLEDNLSFFKGKFLIKEHLKHNLVRKERFYMAYDEFHLNRPENKLIKATVLKLQRQSSCIENIRLSRQILGDLEFIEPSTHYQKDFARIKLDRITKDYENLMVWSKVFLQNKSFSTFQGTNGITALLFPMEKLFESHITKSIDEHFGGWKVERQKQSGFLFDLPKIFRVKPDIYLSFSKDSGFSPVVMDTKWKRLIADRKQKYGISQADMYQMYAYAYKYNVSEVIVIYPYYNGIFKGEIACFQQIENQAKNLKKDKGAYIYSGLERKLF